MNKLKPSSTLTKSPQRAPLHTPNQKSKIKNQKSKTVIILLALLVLSPGCAAITNPVVNGIPVRRIPPELLSAPRRDGLRTVPLTALRREPPEAYRFAPGDVLGIYISGILPATGPNQIPPAPPVNFQSSFDARSSGVQPSLGFPFPVMQDGTLILPLIDPVNVEGLTDAETAQKIFDVYLEDEQLAEGAERPIVTLMSERIHRVLVLRQELGGLAGRGFFAQNANRIGAGQIVNLRGYENDVLHSLTDTGGFPSPDTHDTIIIFKGGQKDRELGAKLEDLTSDTDLASAELTNSAGRIIHIPTRYPPGQPLPFEPEDIILETGDIVFLEARNQGVFYTGGLLPPGEQILPRDIDLDVVEAVMQVGGSLIGGAFSGSSLSGGQLSGGIGNPNPSALTVLRRTPSGHQVPIRVDLNRALRDSRERIIVQPGDILILQETPGEAFGRYVSQVFNFNIFFNFLNRGSATGTGTAVFP